MKSPVSNPKVSFAEGECCAGSGMESAPKFTYVVMYDSKLYDDYDNYQIKSHLFLQGNLFSYVSLGQ